MRRDSDLDFVNSLRLGAGVAVLVSANYLTACTGITPPEATPPIKAEHTREVVPTPQPELKIAVPVYETTSQLRATGLIDQFRDRWAKALNPASSYLNPNLLGNGQLLWAVLPNGLYQDSSLQNPRIEKYSTSIQNGVELDRWRIYFSIDGQPYISPNFTVEATFSADRKYWTGTDFAFRVDAARLRAAVERMAMPRPSSALGISLSPAEVAEQTQLFTSDFRSSIWRKNKGGDGYIVFDVYSYQVTSADTNAKYTIKDDPTVAKYSKLIDLSVRPKQS